MKIAVDKNQFAGSHGKSNAKKHNDMKRMGIEIIPIPLPFGDYCVVTDELQETIDRRGDKLKKVDIIGDVKLSVDSKKDLLEVCGNICGKSHPRFRDEVILAKKMNAKLIILVEEPDIHDVRDVFRWQNPRMRRYNYIKYMHSIGKWDNVPLPKKPPTSGKTLAKAMITIHKKYGVDWIFCSKEEAGKKIVELLEKS